MQRPALTRAQSQSMTLGFFVLLFPFHFGLGCMPCTTAGMTRCAILIARVLALLALLTVRGAGGLLINVAPLMLYFR